MVSDLIKALQKLAQPEVHNEGHGEREFLTAGSAKQGLQGLRGYKPSNTMETLKISQDTAVSGPGYMGLQGLHPAQSEVRHDTYDHQDEHFVTPVTPEKMAGLHGRLEIIKENQTLTEFVTRNPCNPEKSIGGKQNSLSLSNAQQNCASTRGATPHTEIPQPPQLHPVPPGRLSLWVALSPRAVESLAREIAALNLDSEADRAAALRARLGPSVSTQEAQADLAKILERIRIVGKPEAPKAASEQESHPAAGAAPARGKPLAEQAQAELIAEMRPPDLQELVAQYGGYNKITPEAWAEFDLKTKLQRERMVRGDFEIPPYKGLRNAAPTPAPTGPWWTDPHVLAKLDAAGLADAAGASGYFLIMNETNNDFRVTKGKKANPALDNALQLRRDEMCKFLCDREQGRHSLEHKCGRIFTAWRDAFGLDQIVDIDILTTGDIPHELDCALLALAAHDADRTAIDGDKLKRALRAMGEIAANGLRLKYEGASETGADRWSLQTCEPATAPDATADATSLPG